MQLFKIIMGILSRMISFTLVRDGKDGEPGQDGKPGKDGKDGKIGPLPYPAGEWQNDIEYIGTDKIKPFVIYNNEYYCLKSNKSVKGENPAFDVANNKGNWLYMEKFQAIVTELLFTKFASLGSFIISGDYMLSQHGVDNNGNPSKEYQNFPDNFHPNFLVDGKTGEMVANNGKFSGSISFKYHKPKRVPNKPLQIDINKSSHWKIGCSVSDPDIYKTIRLPRQDSHLGRVLYFYYPPGTRSSDYIKLEVENGVFLNDSKYHEKEQTITFDEDKYGNIERIYVDPNTLVRVTSVPPMGDGDILMWYFEVIK